ncbi:MAG TPA: MFS transporter [Chloroflexi bacterium]|nr:MFS transporter [Chloroflexota bacterium]
MFNVIITGITSFLTDISSEMIYPLLPLYLTTQLGASPAIVGLIEGIAESLASLLKVFSGYISDRVQKRKGLAMLGYASSTVGKFLLFLSTSWVWVLGGRIVDRFGKGVRTAPRDALIADSTAKERRGRAFGLHRALDTAGAVVGVGLAYYFLTTRQGDYKAVFLYSLIPAALGVAVLSLARETKAVKATASERPLSFNWSALPTRLKAFLAVVLLFTLGNSSNQFLLLRAKNLGFTPESVLLLYMAYNIIYALFSYPAGRLSDRIGRKSLLVAGYIFYGLVYFGFALVREASYLWLLFAAYGLYIALTEGVQKALMADLAPVELRATLIGLHATFVGIGLFPASFLAGVLWDAFGAPAPFYFGGAMGLLAALGLWLFI